MKIADNLPELIRLVEQAYDKIPELDWKDWTTSKAMQDTAIAEAKALLEPIGARISQNSYSHVIRLGGFQASCTSSFDGALYNWLIGARKRLEA